ncbi:MAG: class I SAM-dependent methyltransferase [Chloroflexi bacterium]|nr:class I SAM-dependent methyltransferase [Chloroflexota bacterium]MCY3957761.1 class I SAM-dependent methyltransferase [Chloroflexota bacterium]
MRSSDSSATRSEVWADRAAEREANLANWNDRVAAHLASPGYDVEGFVSDSQRIAKAVKLDREDLGDVRGQSLLHLQCHIGLDTLSWARLGAQVTGLDFSGPAIHAAREISSRCQTPATFVESDVYEALKALNETFDIVYASEGVLCWLPDVAAWAQVLSQLTRPGGTAYIRDGHPVVHSLDLDSPDGRLEFVGPYFEGQALRYDEPGTYVESDVSIDHTVNFEWNHALGEIVNAFIDAGFRIDSLREYPFSAYRAIPDLVEGPDGWWRLRDHPGRVPFMFSVRATLPE